MGYDLRNGNRYRSVNMARWPALLSLAEYFGWEPEGTVLPSNPQWKGGYGSNDFQRVTDTDARAMASALRAALAAPNDERWARAFGDLYTDFVGEMAEFFEAGGFRIG